MTELSLEQVQQDRELYNKRTAILGALVYELAQRAHSVTVGAETSRVSGNIMRIKTNFVTAGQRVYASNDLFTMEDLDRISDARTMADAIVEAVRRENNLDNRTKLRK